LEDEKGFMDFEFYQKIIDEAVEKGVKAIKLQSRGEAMLHPNIIDAISYAKTKGIIDIHLTTNATLLREDIWNNFCNAGLDILNFSIDANHKESYENLHGKDSYENKVLKNVAGFLNLKKKQNLLKPFVKIQMVRDKEFEGFFSKYIRPIEHLADAVVAANNFDLLDDPEAIRKTNNQKIPCSWLWQRMVINYDGRVSVCCRDYNCTMIMGDKSREPLEEIWNGPKYSEARKLHLEEKRGQINFCAVCDLF
jgi:wyosine [tRNA(Phe)-imidazoG37] synthetase (radical SAM superfamily)